MTNQEIIKLAALGADLMPEDTARAQQFEANIAQLSNGDFLAMHIALKLLLGKRCWINAGIPELDKCRAVAAEMGARVSTIDHPFDPRFEGISCREPARQCLLFEPASDRPN